MMSIRKWYLARKIRKHFRQFLVAVNDKDNVTAKKVVEKILGLSADVRPAFIIPYAEILAAEGREDEVLDILQAAVRKDKMLRADYLQARPGFETIKDTPQFRQVLDIAEENRQEFERQELDPYCSGGAYDIPSTKSLGGIIKHFARQRTALKEYASWFGPHPSHEEDWKLLRTKVKALDQFIDRNPRDRRVADALLEKVKTFAQMSKPVGFSGYIREGTYRHICETMQEFETRELADTAAFREVCYIRLKGEWEVELMKHLRKEDNTSRIPDDREQALKAGFMRLADAAKGEKTEGLALIDYLGTLRDRMGDPDTLERLRPLIKKYRDVKLRAQRCGIPKLYLIHDGNFSFTATDMAGNVRKLDDYRGRILVFHFWATWCGCCEAGMETLKQIREKYDDSKVALLGVALENRKTKPLEKFREWCISNSVTWPQVYQGNGWNSSLARQFQITGIPTMLLFNENLEFVGETHRLFLEEWLEKNLPANG